MKYIIYIENINNPYNPSFFIKENGFKNKSFHCKEDALLFLIQNSENVLLLIIDTFIVNEPILYMNNIKLDTPILIVTEFFNQGSYRSSLYENGACEILDIKFEPKELNIKVKNIIELREMKAKLFHGSNELNSEIKNATDILIKREQETLHILGKTAEWKDPETSQHVSRVAHYSKLLAEKAGMDNLYQDQIFFASPFHDIGKVGIPDEILLKPGKLTAKEFEIMKQHASIGYEILKDSDSVFLQMGAEISISHHEKWDGSGYPYGLKGRDIALSGRIVAIADVFDALTSTRPYKSAWSFDDALALLSEESEIHFDPILVEIFKNNIEDVSNIYNLFN